LTNLVQTYRTRIRNLTKKGGTLKTQQILNRLFTLFEKKSVLLVIQFGNKNGSDIDIFVLLKNDSQYGNTSLGKLDITHIGIVWIEKLTLGLDPILTEPFITGEVIFGDKSFVDKTKEEFIVKNKTCYYLFQSSIILHNWALWFIERGDFKKGLINLSFAYSYSLFAYEYFFREMVITYKGVSERHNILKRLKEKIKKYNLVTVAEINEIRTSLFQLLTEIEKKLE